MSRFARARRVFFIEEPQFEDAPAHMRFSVCPKTGVRVHTPVLPYGLSRLQIIDAQEYLLHQMMMENRVTDYLAWYYTPMAKEFTAGLRPRITIYDCMDELSAFAGAPTAMRTNEFNLFRDADLVFTGGATLFESKRKQHHSVHLFPSSVDVGHFASARTISLDPEDQRRLGRPRLGYAGVIDERMDLDLIRYIARERPNWQIVLVGPVVKIDPASLPKADNIHYLGMKQYADLPAYFSGWDAGMLPFALNESTRFISPTKTPEYLAAGLRVISTPIRDVVTPYGDLDLVQIAHHPREFISAADSVVQSPPSGEFLSRVDRFLRQSSWEKTWIAMNTLIDNLLTVNTSSIRIQTELSTTANVTAKGTPHV
jgi:UDP-galactopyranose mutase